jgi:hypothetical protein
MPNEKITLHCTISGGPGASWSVELEFAGTLSGFKVWGSEGDLTDGVPTKRQIAEINRALDWREVCRFLLVQRHLCIEGDSGTRVNISGVKEYEADMIESVFVIDEDSGQDRHLIARLLLGFADEELQEFFEEFGTPINPRCVESDEFDEINPYETIEEFAQYGASRGFLGEPLSSIRQQIESDSVSLASIEQLLRLMVEQKQNMLVEQLIGHTESLNIKEVGLSKIVCTDQISFLLQELINTGAPQNKHVLRLLNLITMLDRESRLTLERQTGYWAALLWLSSTSDALESALRACSEESKVKAIELASFVLILGREIAPLFEPGYRWTGGPLGAAIARSVAQKKLSIVMRFQRVCNDLGLLIPEHLLFDKSKFSSND